MTSLFHVFNRFWNPAYNIRIATSQFATILKMVRFSFSLLLLSSSSPALAFTLIVPRASLRSALKASSDEFVVGILGDLHMDPRKMEDYVTGREQWLPIFEEAKSSHGNAALVSLGDLGESKSVRPDETSELFAGTTECHELAAEYLGSFGVPYEVVGGNHGK
jgi:hypothetical protein